VYIARNGRILERAAFAWVAKGTGGVQRHDCRKGLGGQSEGVMGEGMLRGGVGWEGWFSPKGGGVGSRKRKNFLLRWGGRKDCLVKTSKFDKSGGNLIGKAKDFPLGRGWAQFVHSNNLLGKGGGRGKEKLYLL